MVKYSPKTDLSIFTKWFIISPYEHTFVSKESMLQRFKKRKRDEVEHGKEGEDAFDW